MSHGNQGCRSGARSRALTDGKLHIKVRARFLFVSPSPACLLFCPGHGARAKRLLEINCERHNYHGGRFTARLLGDYDLSTQIKQ
jgi:hypothetical protein